MHIKQIGIAGTMESSDIMIRIEPKETKGIDLHLSSSVMQQFGKQIEHIIQSTLEELDVDAACVTATDKGALDCTVRARVETAAHRAAGSDQYVWRTKQ
ncbi:MAG: citrate lyase acyl carrier protein [Eubacteriales bacterium]|nr:citrate lyase acyl carrier protein [Eubacteriales bacterium]